MNTRNKLIEARKLIGTVQEILGCIIESQPKQPSGKPPQPGRGQRVKRELLNAWDELKAKGQFTASQARKIVTKGFDSRYTRSNSSYSAVLSNWAQDGYIEKIQSGRGQRPAIYQISS